MQLRITDIPQITESPNINKDAFDLYIINDVANAISASDAQYRKMCIFVKNNSCNKVNTIKNKEAVLFSFLTNKENIKADINKIVII